MKRLAALTLALLMMFCLVACGGGESPADVKGETFDAGNVSTLVPEGWMAFPVDDMWSDGKDPYKMNVAKGAKASYDLFTSPSIGIIYTPDDTVMAPPDKEYYDNAEDIGPITIGDYTWVGFKATKMDVPVIVIWTEEGPQLQATLWLQNGDKSFNFEDLDVQAILYNIAVKA